MVSKKILITGGAGFVGTNLITRLLRENAGEITVFDKLDSYPEKKISERIVYVKGNLTDMNSLENLFKSYGPFVTIYHLASEMPNKLANDRLMFDTNVKGTASLIRLAVKSHAHSFIFTSSNVVYGIPKVLPVDENSPVGPLESYGRSKIRAEEELFTYKNKINIQIFRCPVITGVGRLGLQAILYEFISENRKVYVLGKGNNRYQFIDVEDVVEALIKSSKAKGFDMYVIGADEVVPLKELYQKVIDYAKSKSKIVPLPFSLGMAVLTVLDRINFSPLGVYQISMMGRSIYADTTKLKEKLGWHPKKTNADTFIENYKWYSAHKGEFSQIGGRADSPNRSVPKMGILKLLKLVS